MNGYENKSLAWFRSKLKLLIRDLNFIHGKNPNGGGTSEIKKDINRVKEYLVSKGVKC